MIHVLFQLSDLTKQILKINTLPQIYFHHLCQQVFKFNVQLLAKGRVTFRNQLVNLIIKSIL